MVPTGRARPTPMVEGGPRVNGKTELLTSGGRYADPARGGLLIRVFCLKR